MRPLVYSRRTGVFTKPDVPQTYLRRHYPDQVGGYSARADLSLSAPLFSCPMSSISTAGKMSSPRAAKVPFWGGMRYNGVTIFRKAAAALKITALVENTVPEDLAAQLGLGKEHGLSLYIEACGHKILFDMGQSGLFARNAAALGGRSRGGGPGGPLPWALRPRRRAGPLSGAEQHRAGLPQRTRLRAPLPRRGAVHRP